MKKRYKLLKQNSRILILHWETDGMLFGPEWVCIASFENAGANQERIKTIIRLMNECDKHTEQSNNDRKGTINN